MDLVHRYNPPQLRLDLLDHLRRARGNDGDAAEVTGVVDLCHGEAVDVVSTARKQTDDARQHAGFVLDQYGQRVAFDHIREIGT